MKLFFSLNIYIGTDFSKSARFFDLKIISKQNFVTCRSLYKSDKFEIVKLYKKIKSEFFLRIEKNNL